MGQSCSSGSDEATNKNISQKYDRSGRLSCVVIVVFNQVVCYESDRVKSILIKSNLR